jgi:hypothetical protein
MRLRRNQLWRWMATADAQIFAESCMPPIRCRHHLTRAITLNLARRVAGWAGHAIAFVSDILTALLNRGCRSLDRAVSVVLSPFKIRYRFMLRLPSLCISEYFVPAPSTEGARLSALLNEYRLKLSSSAPRCGHCLTSRTTKYKSLFFKFKR